MFKISFLILLFSSQLYANSIELIGGGITEHFFVDQSVSHQFSNQLGDNGNLIYNQLFGFAYTENNELFYNSYKFFMGRNSINEQMGGFLDTFGVQLDDYDVGFGIGGYLQDGSKFQSIGVNIGDFMPVYGIEFNKKFNFDNKFIKLNNFLTPLLYNFSISIGENF